MYVFFFSSLVALCHQYEHHGLATTLAALLVAVCRLLYGRCFILLVFMMQRKT